jgi:single-stranded DNA-binding protein
MNRFQGIGNITKDPIRRDFENGRSLISFPMAISNRYWSKKEKQFKNGPTLWLGVSIWSRVDFFEKALRKGMRLFVIGSISITEKDGKKWVNLNISDMSENKDMCQVMMKTGRGAVGRDDEYALADEDVENISVDTEDESPF